MSEDVVARGKAALSGITPEPWDVRDGFIYPLAIRCGLGAIRPQDAEFIAAAPELVRSLVAEVERQERDRREFTSRLGFGDDITEPAAALADMVDPIEAAFADSRDHQECPRICEQCGERLAETLCPECHGSGYNGPACAASLAYVECEYCGGSGWVHDGCAELSYADLVAEVERVRLERDNHKLTIDRVADELGVEPVALNLWAARNIMRELDRLKRLDAREKVAKAINPNHPDMALRTGMADAAIAAHLEALKSGGYAVVKLPESPSEYWGPEHQPQWNHYPFTRVDGDEVEIGARCEHVFRVNLIEARVFAADVLAAADAAEADR